MAKSGLDTVKVGDTYRFAKTVGETDIVAVAEHIMRWAKKLSSNQG